MTAIAAPTRQTTPPVVDTDQRVTALHRLRWAVRTVLLLGVIASIAANILHARPNIISQAISAWPPLALLLTVELISRVPAHQRAWAITRLLAAAIIAGIAAWVSYWHMAGVAARYGETGAGASYLLPVSVDGLVVVASISLVEISGRIDAYASPEHALTDQLAPKRRPRQLESTATPAQPTLTPTQPLSRPPSPVAQPLHTQGADHGKQVRHEHRDLDHEPVDARDGQTAGTGRSDLQTQSERTKTRASGETTEQPTDVQTAETPRTDRSPEHAEPAADLKPLRDDEDRPGPNGTRGRTASHDGDDGESAGQGEPVPAKTPAAVAYWHQRDPTMHPADIAARIGRSERTVRRYWPPTLQRAQL